MGTRFLSTKEKKNNCFEKGKPRVGGGRVRISHQFTEK